MTGRSGFPTLDVDSIHEESQSDDGRQHAKGATHETGVRRAPAAGGAPRGGTHGRPRRALRVRPERAFRVAAGVARLFRPGAEELAGRRLRGSEVRVKGRARVITLLHFTTQNRARRSL